MARKVGRKKGSHPGSRRKRTSPDSSGAWAGASEDASSSGAWPDDAESPRRPTARKAGRRRASKAKEFRESAESTESGPWPKEEASRSSGAWSESSNSEDPGIQRVQNATHAMNAEDVIVRGALKREGGEAARPRSARHVQPMLDVFRNFFRSSNAFVVARRVHKG